MTTRRPNNLRSRRTGLALGLVIALVAVVFVTVTAAILLRRDTPGADGEGSMDLYTVRTGSFDITIPTSGELAAKTQAKIRNKLETQAVISEIVAEGTIVQAGDVLLRLNDETIRERIRDAEEAVSNAENALANAVANLDIRKKTRESELAKASLEIRLAGLALNAWEEGEEVSRRRSLTLAIETAQKNYDRLNERYIKSVELAESNYISTDELKRDEIEMIRAKATLEQAELDLMVYEQYQYEQDRARKESDVQQAKDERDRLQQRLDAEVRSAEADLENRQDSLKSRRERLAKYKEQLEHCTVRAPTGGLVVYASSLRQGRHGRNEGQPPQVGTSLARNDWIIALPDTSQMVAEVKVNEALSGQIKVGQRAVVVSDAAPERSLGGEVIEVGVLAESGGWRDPNRRDYTVRVLLDDVDGLALKPSMRCKADIFVGRVEDAIHVPIQAVLRAGPTAYVYVPQGSGYAQRAVALGRSSELFVEILDGLSAGDQVLLREPRLEEVVAMLEPVPQRETRFVSDERPARSGPPRNGAPEGRAPGHSEGAPMGERPGRGMRRPRGDGPQGDHSGGQEGPARPAGVDPAGNGPSHPTTAPASEHQGSGAH